MRALAALAAALLIAGCCHCSDARVPEHPQRPGDVVRELRDAIGDHHWDVASELFSDEVRTANAAAMKDGSFFERPRVIPLGSSQPWPIGPRDTLLAVDLKGDEAFATIDHANRMDKDPRPRVLVLRKQQGLWKIVEWRNWA